MSQVYPETYTNGRTENRGRIAVIGGGLVGCVAALQLAKKGYQIDLYESRSDIRKAVVVAGRSINLALSARGRKALAEVLLEDKILYDALPMEGRMLHSVSGSTRVVPYDQKNKQVEQFNRFTSFVRNYFLEWLFETRCQSKTTLKAIPRIIRTQWPDLTDHTLFLLILFLPYSASTPSADVTWMKCS